MALTNKKKGFQPSPLIKLAGIGLQRELKMYKMIVAISCALISTCAVAGQYGREARDQCATAYPETTGKGLSARMRCMANHPLSYGFSDYERAYINNGMRMGQRVEHGEMSYSTAIAYMDRMESDFQADYVRRLANGFLNGMSDYRVTNCSSFGNSVSCNSW